MDKTEHLDLQDVSSITLYGAELQKKVAELSKLLLQGLNTSENDDFSVIIHDAMSKLNQWKENSSAKKKVFGLLAGKRAAENDRQETLRSVEKLEKSLEERRVKLLMESTMLMQFQRMNTEYATQLEERVLRMREKKEELIAEKSKKTATEVTLLEDMIRHMERRMEELQVTKVIASQQAAQLQVLVGNASAMAAGLQSTLYNVLPLWKNQMAAKAEGQGAKGPEGEQAGEMLIGSLNEIFKISEERTNQEIAAQTELQETGELPKESVR